MYKALIITCLTMISATVPPESIYNFSVNTIEGDSKPLSAYEGKKLLIITLPIEENVATNSLLHSLDSLITLYNSSLKIIGVPSYEDGYMPSNKQALKQWYRSILGQNVIVTEGMYTRKSSGNQQHNLFKWLCSKEKNGHFNNDVEGPGSKFFVWNDGVLTGVLGSQTSIKSSVVNELLQ